MAANKAEYIMQTESFMTYWSHTIVIARNTKILRQGFLWKLYQLPEELGHDAHLHYSNIKQSSRL